MRPHVSSTVFAGTSPVGVARSPRGRGDRGFTLIELLVTMAITTVILGATMAAMNDAIRATESAQLVTSLNNGLRTAMDLMVRDMLQVGQGLPSGRVILVPSGAGAVPMQLPGPPGSNFQLDGPSFCPPDTFVCSQISAVIPGPGRGPEVIPGQPTDMISTVQADSAFDQVPLTAFAADGTNVTVALPANTPRGVNITNGGADDLNPGDLLMLVRGSASALVQITRVVNQQVFFDTGDSLGVNQFDAALGGTAFELRTEPSVDVLSGCCMSTTATRVRLITYYLDTTTDPLRPRLVRRINNGSGPGDELVFDNTRGTVVAFDIENLTISYDLAAPDGAGVGPTNVRMTDADIDGSGDCAPDPCSANQIRKVNIVLAGRSRRAMRGTNQFFRNRLSTQVSLRSLSFVDRYQ
jgi:prepilin-type N-terminal cleavage/methylation domain-containing protein